VAFQGSKRGISDWHVVSALTYNAYVGTEQINFASYALMNPKDWAPWENSAKASAAMIWNAYKHCKGQVMAELEDGI
jgi:hypothetical protein